MKISARNQLRGTVTAVHKGAVNADVLLDLRSGLTIFANITNEAVDDLGLKPGKAATALIKSSFILLSPDAHIRISARNRLPGRITDVIPGAVNSEIKLALAGGTVLNAIVTVETVQDLGLAVGEPCTAFIKSSHVLIAVDD
jgi:molybdate transport system regulatory protein